MMYQLKDMSKIQQRHNEQVAADRESYGSFEGIHDSLNLMKNQRNEMKTDRKFFTDKYESLTFGNAEEIIPQAQ